MRNSQAKKDANRLLILEAAGRLFREHGISGVSVADVMHAASMTHGGFYRHFADKSDLVTHTLAKVLDLGAEPGSTDIGDFADTYLSEAHRNETAGGCAFAALASEVVRGPEAPRHVMTSTIRQQIHSFTQSLPGTEETSRQTAIGSWATMIGALVLARVSSDDALAEEILGSARTFIEAGVNRHSNSIVQSKY